MKYTAEINNTPNLDKYTWITATIWNGEIWFYGAWYANQKAEAEAQAREINGIVLKKEEA